MADIVEDLHWAFRGEDPAYRVIPDDDELTSQLLLVYDGEDLYDLVDRDFQHARITLNLNVHSANAIDEVMTEMRAYLEAEVGDRFAWDIGGVGRLFADMEELLVAGQVYSLWGALVLIYLFMLILWRAPWGAALCMIPNLSPILLIFIIMGAFGIWLDMATAMIASVAVGIAVDDTIHVYHGFRTRLDRGSSAVVALVRSYREAGRAVVVTTLILSAQFLVLVTSDFVPSSNFGLLTMIGLVTAMLFDLLLLPALLIIIHGDHSPVARMISRLRGRQPAQIADEFDEADPTVDSSYWTPQRRSALVRELLAGNLTTTTAASEYKLPREELDKWLERANQGIDEALGGRPRSARRDPAKVRALARAYKKLKEENRALKSKIGSD
jgi:transposase-like protein